MSRFSYKTLFIILFFLLIAIVVLLKFIFPNQKVSAAWWNDSWMYRKAVSISNTSGSNLTDFQVSISVGTSALIASGKMQSDCDDIRITDNTGKILNFWIEENNPGCNAVTDTKIWVKASSLPTSGAIVYIYYGNSSATNIQNGNNVFEFFDDFSGTNLNSSKWTNNSSATINLSGGTASFTETSDNINQNIYATSYNSTGSITFESRQNITTTTATEFGGLSMKSNNASSTHKYKVGFANGGYSFWYWNSSTFTQSAGATIPISGYSINKLTFTGTAYQGFVNNTQIQSNMTNEIFAKNVPAITPGVESGIILVDWVIARKYASTDPTPTLQSEEIGTAPIAYWKFDEGVGTTVYDSSPSHNNSILSTGNSAPNWQSEDVCISGKCLKFDGSNDYINTNKDFSWSTSDSFSIGFWIKTNSVGTTQGIIGKGAAGGYGDSNWEWSAKIQGSNFGFSYWDINGTGIISLTSTITPNQWEYFIVTYNPTDKAKLYKNGIVVSTDTDISGTLQNRNTPILIGHAYYSAGTNYYYNGFLDEVKIYHYSRTAAQIKLDYNAGKAHSSSSQGSSASLGNNKNNGDLSDGLVGYWKMDENIGTTTADYSGNNNIGTFGTGNSAPSWSSGKYGIGLSFAGAQSITIGTSIFSTNNASQPYTISTWIKTNSTSTDGIVTQYSSGSPSSRFGFRLNSGGFAWWKGGSNLAVSTTNINDNNWHHIVGTKDSSGKVKLYLDGNINGNGGTDTLAFDNFSTQIGTFNGAAPYTGLIDEVRIYNRALSPNEVENLYNYAPGPIGYWDFEEKTGTVVNDKSGNNLTGTFGIGNSAPSWSSGKYGSGINFSSTTKFIQITPSSKFTTNTSGSSFSYSLWFKPNNVSASNQHLITNNSPCNNSGSFTIKLSSGIIYLNYYSLSLPGTVTHSFTPSTTLQNNNWYHLEWTKTFGQLGVKAYLNGIPQTVTGDNAATGNTDSRILFGAWNGTGSTCTNGVDDSPPVANMSLNGSIDEVKLYNYIRTQKQIIEDMNGGKPAGSAKSMLAYYKFDEGSGTIVNNVGNGGVGLSGVVSGATWTNNGKFGKALNFNGSNNYISTPYIPGINSQLSVSAWINPTTLSSYEISNQGQWDGGPWTGWRLQQTSNSITFKLGDGTSIPYTYSAGTIIANTWQHVVGVWDGTYIHIYVNGKEAGKSAKTFNYLGNTNTHWIGKYPGAAYFYNGLIDEVKIYNYALTDDEIKLDYNKGSTLQMGKTSQSIGATTTSLDYCIPGDTTFCASPVAEWKMDEKTGTTIKDTSGNNNTGTFGAGSSAPTWTTGKIGAGLSFNGSTNGLSLSGPSTYAHETMSAWVYIDSSSPSGDIIGNCHINFNSEYGFTFYLDGNTLRAKAATNAITYFYDNVTYDVTSLKNKWLYLTMTWDNLGTGTGGCDATLKLYVNGQLVDQATSNFSGGYDCTKAYGYPFSMGATTQTSLTRPTKVKLDQVRIYNYARTPAQIAYDYNKGAPIAHWKLDDCQGNIAQDSSGIGNTGTIIIGASGTQNSLGTCQIGTSAAWTAGASGKYNSSLNFDGVDDCINMGDPVNNSLDFGLNDFSTSVWVKTSTNNTGVIVGKYSGYPLFYSRINAGKIESRIGFDSSTNFTSTDGDIINDNLWHQIITVYKRNGNMIRYLDGKIYGSSLDISSVSTRTVDTTNNFCIASASCGSQFFTGQIDDVRIYNYALTSEQIKILYNGGSVSFN